MTEQKETIIDCEWQGWCREYCQNKKLRRIVMYKDNIPVCVTTTKIKENKDCIYYESDGSFDYLKRR